MKQRDLVRRVLRSAGEALRRPRRSLLALLEFEKYYFQRRVARHGITGGLPTIDIMALCPGFRERVDPYAWLEGGSLAIDLALLKCLARRVPHTNYLEIGTWRGESLANVATVAESCYSVSLSDEEMRAAGWGQRFVDTARVFSRDLPNVTHIGHDSRTFNFGSLPPMDLVFVDGDHSHDGVMRDTRSAFQTLRDDSSIIVWHDYSRTPERDVNWDIVAGILDGCPPDRRNSLYHISNTLCAAYVPDPPADGRALRVAVEEFPLLPETSFTIDMTASKR